MAQPLLIIPGSVPLTQAQISQRQAVLLNRLSAQIVNDAGVMLQQLDTSLRTSMDRIWNSPDYTPAQAVEALGANAVVLFQGAAATTNFLVNVYALDGTPYTPPAPPAGVTITANADGTITLS